MISEKNASSSSLSDHSSNPSTVKFHINSKEPKSVEILLQQMFVSELETEETVE